MSVVMFCHGLVIHRDSDNISRARRGKTKFLFASVTFMIYDFTGLGLRLGLRLA